MDDRTAATKNSENLSQKEHRKNRHKRVATEVFLEFSEKTTLHGLPYVTQFGISTVEKIFWFLMFVISIVLCFLLILEVWFKWRDSPVIVTINERMMPVEEVPFPSVTICPQMKNKISDYEYTKQYSKYHSYVLKGYDGLLNDTIERELKMLDDAMLVCNSYNAHQYVLRRNTTDESTVQNIEKIAPTLKETVMIMAWHGGLMSKQVFSKVLTSEGVCFTFNTMRHTNIFKNESIQNKYLYVHPTPKQTVSFNFFDFGQEKVYPRRGRESGAVPDLIVILQQNVRDNDGLCNGLYNGFKIYLHHPYDMPQSPLYYYPLLPGQVTSLALKFSAISTSESLMKYAPKMRQCYSSSDRKLRYFKTYTFSNCKLECLSIFTYETCGCVPFHIPHSNSSEICTSMKRKCAERAQIRLASTKSMTNMVDLCDCLPSCNSVQYDADVLKTNFEWHNYNKIMFNNTKEGFNVSRLEMYFKEPQFMSILRSERFGLTDFLANCGGLLGLFLGFSFLSIVEIFYFCTLRLWYALKRDNIAVKTQCDQVSDMLDKKKNTKRRRSHTLKCRRVKYLEKGRKIYGQKNF